MLTEVEKTAAVGKFVEKLQSTSIRVHREGFDKLVLDKDDFETTLGIVFGDPNIDKIAGNAGFKMPSKDLNAPKFHFKIEGGTPSVEFVAGNIQQVRFSAADAICELGIGDVEPKELKLNKFSLALANYMKPSDGQRMPGQIATVGTTVEPNYKLSDIPGAPSSLPSIGSDVQTVIKWAIDGNYIMPFLYNVLVPVIAVNGPDRSKVMGLEADIGTDNVTLSIYRDKFTPYATRTGLPQIKGYVKK